MLSNLGNILLFGSIFITLSIIYFAYQNIKEKNILVGKNLVYLSLFQITFIIASFLLLIFAFVFSDFSLLAVYQNSHTAKPIFYKIAGVWGNHEGSLLLWVNIMIIFSFLFFLINYKSNKSYCLYTLLVQNILILGFLVFLISNSNPFFKILPIPSEGLGLNPILQDPALAIHPPILYIGYVGTSLIFSSSLAAVINKTVNSEWAKQIKKWIFISWIFLTLGIMLGSIWAYYELGWGGFWFWDPVENVSLMPWFCLTALLHTILVLEKRNALRNWTIILSIATFSLSMSGTFLVRSGILNSIHTFANDPSRGLFILTFLFFLIFLSIIVLFIYSENDKKNSNNFNILSKETAVLVNNWFMMYFLSVVLIGTIYPIFLEVFTNEKISVGPPFYQKLMIPFLIPFFIFMSFGPRVKWIKDKLKRINYTQIIIFILSLIIAYVIFTNSSVSYLFSSFLIAASIFLVLNSLRDFFSKSIQIPQKISHFSFSILILSILLNGIYSEEFNSNMKVGDELKFIDKTIKFKGINFDEKDNYKLLRGDFEVIDSRKNTLNFNPEIRIYNQPVISTSEADIKTNLFNDNFIVFTLLKDNEIFNVRYQHKPFMIWIWISIIMLAFGGTLAVIKYGK